MSESSENVWILVEKFLSDIFLSVIDIKEDIDKITASINPKLLKNLGFVKIYLRIFYSILSKNKNEKDKDVCTLKKYLNNIKDVVFKVDFSFLTPRLSTQIYH